MGVCFPRFLIGAAVLFLGSAGPASSGSDDDVPMPLMSAAECMVRTLKTVPGVSDVQINVMPAKGSAYPVLTYRFADAAGRRRFTELSLFEITGADEPYVFDRADIQDDLVAERLLPIWKTRCHTGFGYITSLPR
jgi:hypothetical protein